jgi:signal transduction histidine kinase/ligand-binding sensor domain-containing protein
VRCGWSVLLLGAALTVGAVAAERYFEPEFLIRKWDWYDGLPGNLVEAIARTPDGYLWASTPDGLARFDGVRFTAFNSQNTPALKEQWLTALLADRQGALWGASLRGTMVKREGSRFVELAHETSARVNCLAEAADGSVWAGTATGEITPLADGGQTRFGPTNGLPRTAISALVRDGENQMWALAGGKLYHLQGEEWKALEPTPPGLPVVTAMAANREGGLWVALQAKPGTAGNGARIFTFAKGQWLEDAAPYPWNQESRRSGVLKLLEDHSGRLWCLTRGAGVYFRKPSGSWHKLTEQGELSYLQSNCVFEDGEGAIWIGTEAAGLYQVRPRLVQALSPPPEASRDLFWTVCARSDGSIWGGTEHSGAWRWEAGAAECYGPAAGLRGQVSVLLEDRQTNLLAGTSAGLLRLAGERFEDVAGPAELRRPVSALLATSGGSLWVGTDAGLVRLSEGKSMVFTTRQGVPTAAIRAIEEDRDGRLWLAIPGRGLYRQEGDQFARYPADPWRAGATVRALHADADGGLWIGTYGNWLFRLKDGQFTEYSNEDGVPNHRFLAILEDRQGNLWFSSDYGVFGCPRRILEQYRRGQSRRLNWWRPSREEGVPNSVCSGLGQPAATIAPDGRLWFPDGNALMAFDPASLSRSYRLWPPVIEETVVDGVVRLADKDGNLQVKSGFRRLTAHYTSPDTDSPERPWFWVWMTDWDQTWVEVGRTRSANYSRLPPGKHELKVAVSDPSGRWLEAGRSLKLEVVPQFWERGWVRAGGALALLAAAAGAVWSVERARSRRRLERVQTQRLMDQERQRIARDIHDDLGSGLAEIIMVSDHLRQDLEVPPGPASRSRVQNIADRARMLTRAMDEVVWAINPKNDTLESLLSYLDDFAQEHLALAGVRYRWDAPAEVPEFPLSAERRHNLYLACKEAVTNAVKHAKATEVRLRFQVTEAGFDLTVEDNGHGFDPTCQSKRGHGLENMRQRMADIGHGCAIQSGLGEGTRVRFSIRKSPQGSD